MLRRIVQDRVHRVLEHAVRDEIADQAFGLTRLRRTHEYNGRQFTAGEQILRLAHIGSTLPAPRYRLPARALDPNKLLGYFRDTTPFRSAEDVLRNRNRNVSDRLIAPLLRLQFRLDPRCQRGWA